VDILAARTGGDAVSRTGTRNGRRGAPAEHVASQERHHAGCCDIAGASAGEGKREFVLDRGETEAVATIGPSSLPVHVTPSRRQGAESTQFALQFAVLIETLQWL